MNKRFLFAEVKATKAEDPTGEFEAILSAPTLDRDGEIIEKDAFAPLPDSIPVHAFHDFHDPVGVAQPYYEDDLLKVRGYFASTARAQEIRTLVTEGVIGSMSVGFMDAAREEKDGVPTVTKAEILEGSFVSIPSNREAAVLVAKQYEEKVGARNSASDAGRIQGAHDLFVELGAKCADDADKGADVVAAIQRYERLLGPAGAAAEFDVLKKSTTTDPDDSAAPAAESLADVTVALARLAIARAEATQALLT
jgi:HK97 family phage prohead protease